MVIEKIAISELKPAPYNPRKSTEKQEEGLRKSLEKFGVVEPVIYNKTTGHIVGGHFRVRELKKLGYEEIECVVVELSEEDEKELNIRLNANTGEWDFEKLNLEFDRLELSEWGLELEDSLIEEELEAKEDDFEVPERDEIQTDIVRGDIFEFRKDGKTLHRLMCGDSTSVDDVEKLMNGEKADMVFTDPPYGANMGIQNDKVNEFKQVFSDFISLLPCDDNIYICSDWRCIGYFINEIENNSYEIYNLVVWVKNLFGQGKLYHTKHEEIIFCGKGNYRKDKLNNDVNVWQADSVRNFGGSKNAQEAVGHPTQKPVEICSRAINNSSAKNELVYDGFLGSGSTMVASHQLNRRCFGMELDEKYCQVIIDRIRKLDPEIEIIKI